MRRISLLVHCELPNKIIIKVNHKTRHAHSKLRIAIKPSLIYMASVVLRCWDLVLRRSFQLFQVCTLKSLSQQILKAEHVFTVLDILALEYCSIETLTQLCHDPNVQIFWNQTKLSIIYVSPSLSILAESLTCVGSSHQVEKKRGIFERIVPSSFTSGPLIVWYTLGGSAYLFAK